jgi:hypothetical protein
VDRTVVAVLGDQTDDASAVIFGVERRLESRQSRKRAARARGVDAHRKGADPTDGGAIAIAALGRFELHAALFPDRID